MNSDRAREIIRRGGSEALKWLSEDTYDCYGIGEFGPLEARGMLRRGYAAGARRIYIYEVYAPMKRGGLQSDHLLVELPAEAEHRERVLAWARTLGCEPDEDHGQEFLALRLPSA